MSFDTLALKSSGIVDPAEQQAYVIPKLKDKSWCFHPQPAIYFSTKIQHGSIAWDHHFSHVYIFLIVTLFGVRPTDFQMFSFFCISTFRRNSIPPSTSFCMITCTSWRFSCTCFLEGGGGGWEGRGSSQVWLKIRMVCFLWINFKFNHFNALKGTTNNFFVRPWLKDPGQEATTSNELTMADGCHWKAVRHIRSERETIYVNTLRWRNWNYLCLFYVSREIEADSLPWLPCTSNCHQKKVGKHIAWLSSQTRESPGSTWPNHMV